MKILMLSWEFPPHVQGGLGRHVAELSPALADEGISVHVLVPVAKSALPTEKITPNLTLHWVDASAVDPYENIHARARQANALMEAAAAALWQKVGGFDLIHAHDWLVSFAAINLKLAHATPLVATIHATEQGRWRNHPLPDELSRQIDQAEENLSYEAWHVIACSNFMVKELRRQFALPLNKLDMIPNGINLKEKKRYSPEQLATFRAKFALPHQPLIFSVGRLVYEKGYQLLIEGLAQIVSAFPDVRLVIAGRGPLLGYLRDVAQKHNLGQHVHFAGFISDAERDMLFYTADCATFPSLYEPFGIVALESMAHNCPVVVSEVGGFAEVVSHNQMGTLIYPGNPHSAAWGMTQVLNNPVETAYHAANAYHMVAEKYNWHRIAKQTKRVYEQILVERTETDWECAPFQIAPVT